MQPNPCGVWFTYPMHASCRSSPPGATPSRRRTCTTGTSETATRSARSCRPAPSCAGSSSSSSSSSKYHIPNTEHRALWPHRCLRCLVHTHGVGIRGTGWVHSMRCVLLRRGARYRYLGSGPARSSSADSGSSLADQQRAHPWTPGHFALEPASALWPLLCPPDGDGGCAFSSEVTLDQNPSPNPNPILNPNSNPSPKPNSR